MKKFIAVVLCLSLLLLCSCTAPKKNDVKLVAVSFYPVYIFTLNLTDGIDGIRVERMAEQNVGCLHDYTVTAKDAKLLDDCTAFVINGAGMEGFVEDLYSTIDGLFVIDSSQGVEVLCQSEHHEHGDEHNDEHNEHHGHNHTHNSHIWMSVSNAILQVENICNGLIQVFPEHENQLLSNKAAYLERLDALLSEMNSCRPQVEGKSVVAFHDAYEYLAKDLGFKIFTTVKSDEGAEPSAWELAQLTNQIKNHKIKTLLVEPNYNGSSANVLKYETGAEICIINPVTYGENSKTAYEDIMRRNFEILKAVK